QAQRDEQRAGDERVLLHGEPLPQVLRGFSCCPREKGQRERGGGARRRLLGVQLGAQLRSELQRGLVCRLGSRIVGALGEDRSFQVAPVVNHRAVVAPA